jgi:pyruvate,water dikinase
MPLPLRSRIWQDSRSPYARRQWVRTPPRKKIYWDEFIPFAHGVRQLGTYYNDAVKPADPYEFINILRHQPMIATERNTALHELAVYLRERPALLDSLRSASAPAEELPRRDWREVQQMVIGTDGGPELLEQLHQVAERYMDVAYDGEQLDTRPDLVLHTVAELAAVEPDQLADPAITVTAAQDEHEQRLLDAVGTERLHEARSVIAIARLSWRLRDDDNVLIGRIEKQLLRAATNAAERLVRAGRLEAGAHITMESAPMLSDALRDASNGRVVLPKPLDRSKPKSSVTKSEAPRQIVGQPAAPDAKMGRATTLWNRLACRAVPSPGTNRRTISRHILGCGPRT